MRLNKCANCKFTLKKGVQFIATFEMIICTVIITVLTLVLLDVCFGGKTANSVEYFLGIKRELQFTLWFVCWMIAFIKLILDINLYKGVNSKSIEGCKIWLKITGGVLLMNYVWSLMSLNIFWSFHNCMLVLLINVGLGIYKGLEMAIVYKLIQKMKREKVEVFTVSALSASAPRLSIATLNDRRLSGLTMDDSRIPSSSTLSEYLAPETRPNSQDFSLFDRYTPSQYNNKNA